MALKFRKRIKIAPGVYINVSKSGISTSIGGKGATINIGKNGTKATVGIPGTGLSYSTKLSGKKEASQQNLINEQAIPEPEEKKPSKKATFFVLVFYVVVGFILYNIFVS
ncbi:DUF4236 domain-containing protein [Xenorhabdus bovienii]|uniref:DUF4236 domain-containing protein n=1 Tax=Xenorhabdus bovienii TaxID=40576 RepID=UPI00237CB436|nr:DUF4236 domain-containing protein [Xenorhabdus bovienii]MDE1487658.1 DUF4236 domain-containing protein [Xenorhabdus bovienii]MDE9478600.1 DUF4236 domain-containing protein [Xenorhabdus bovienii]MDE9531839.1 DUF4236 domain-containing protein [Xenorhabdus bovienii]MDE9549409.1 DUF4236 domain-containing protein [Xenorhabdus bovienii]